MKIKSVPTWAWVLGGIVLVVVVLLGWIVSGYNNLITLNGATELAWSNVETDYQRRYDLIPNLVETVKGIVKQEKDVFGEVTKLRSQWANAQNPEAKIAASGALEQGIGRLIAVAENYPDLKSSQNFLQLQDQLEGTENRITVSRQRYNDAATKLNVGIRKFPSNIIANMFGFDEKKTYESEAGADKIVKVAFS